ncbi:11704_t:CDS:2, partial [Funneliformis geosporum]
CPLPLSSNIKFTPKHYWEDNPLKKYLQNCDLHDIWNTLNNEPENAKNLWIALADKAIKGDFKDMPIFTGLYEVMALAGISHEIEHISTEEYDNEEGLSNLFQKVHSQLNTIIDSEDLSILYNRNS